MYTQISSLSLFFKKYLHTYPFYTNDLASVDNTTIPLGAIIGFVYGQLGFIRDMVLYVIMIVLTVRRC